MIPAFNAGGYLEEALRSVLQQDPGPELMQIAVVDDASTDVDVLDTMKRVAGARIDYHRHPENIGSVRNINSCLELARGQYVHLLHADDRVLDGYYEVMEHLFARHPEAGACFSGVRYIDHMGELLGVETKDARSDGILEDWLQRIATGPRIQYVALAVKRSVYEELGGYFGVNYGEDWEMHVRIAANYPIAYTPRELAEYRKHPDSISRRKIRTGRNLADMAWVVSAIQNYLPPDERARLRKQAEAHCAQFGLHYARQIWRFERDRTAVELQIQGALRLCDDKDTRRAARELYDIMLIDERGTPTL